MLSQLDLNHHSEKKKYICVYTQNSPESLSQLKGPIWLSESIQRDNLFEASQSPRKQEP